MGPHFLRQRIFEFLWDINSLRPWKETAKQSLKRIALFPHKDYNGKNAAGGAEMEQIERITYMEQILDEASGAVASLSDALDNYSAMQEKLQELIAYYTSEQWPRDFDDDNAGRIPADLKRGVLSEDAVYHLLADNADVKQRLKELSDQ